jgi:hypothetical protein
MKKDQVNFERFKDMIRKPGNNEWLKTLDFNKISKLVSKEISSLLKVKCKVNIEKKFYKGKLLLDIYSNDFSKDISLKIFEDAFINCETQGIVNKKNVKEYFMQLSVSLSNFDSITFNFNFATIIIDSKNNIKIKPLKG